MSDKNDLNGLSDDAAEAASLRQSLERMREQAAREITRLNDRLTAREHDVAHSVASETERLALQQELTLLRQTLSVKEQALERITQACQRLEDQLEDRNLAFDDLRQEVERRDISLQEAHSEVERLQQALAELQNRSISDGAELAEARSQVRRSPPWWQMVLVVFIVAPVSVWIGMRLPSLTQSSPSTPPPSPVALTPTKPEAPPSVPPAPPAKPDVQPDPAGPTDSVTVDDADAVPLVSAPAASASNRPVTRRDWMRDGSVGPLLAKLDGGRFEMGQNSMGTQDHAPAHEVEIAPFFIGVHEVTFEEYDRFAKATRRRLPDDHGWGRGQRPVIDVSWDDAQAYVAWLSEQSGRRYRLPSEAEWEFAARAGTRTPFWWGYDKGEGRAACFDCASPWDNRFTAPIGRFAPNPFGLYDTAGNVAEWVADCYVPSYKGAPRDGSAWILDDCGNRVARGGSFNKPADSIRSYARARFAPSARLKMLGFRVARDP